MPIVNDWQHRQDGVGIGVQRVSKPVSGGIEETSGWQAGRNIEALLKHFFDTVTTLTSISNIKQANKNRQWSSLFLFLCVILILQGSCNLEGFGSQVCEWDSCTFSSSVSNI